MKKLLLSVVTVGAMATAGVASAQDVLGNVLPQILGSVLGNSGVLAQGNYPVGSVYIDQYGRQVQVDQFGRHVVINNQAANIYQGGVVQGAGELVLNSDGSYSRRYPGVYAGSTDPLLQQRGLRDRIDRDGDGVRDSRDRDRDGDGVRNNRDRYPDDPRYR